MKKIMIPMLVLVGLLTFAVPVKIGLASESQQISNVPVSTQVYITPPIDISKEVEGPDTRVLPSGDVTFQITVSKPATGNPTFDSATFATVEVTDPLTPDCDRANLGPLATGQSTTYTCTAPNVSSGFTNEACVVGKTAAGQNFSEDPSSDCDESTVEIEETTGGEGCTPGYWKQEQHFDSWVDFSQADLFSDVFDRVITVRAGGRSTITNPTLLEALNANGGDINALARHGVSALLNASNTDVAFVFTQAEVIQMVQDAIDGSSDLEEVKDSLTEANEAGCPLN
jgi:hypothetical protein